MTRQEVFSWCKQQYGTEPEYPWNDWNVVLRHTDNQKWYGLIMEVGRNKLGLPGDGEVDILNVKSDPMLIGFYRAQKGFFPAYYMNKENWIRILDPRNLTLCRYPRFTHVPVMLTLVKIANHRKGGFHE